MVKLPQPAGVCDSVRCVTDETVQKADIIRGTEFSQLWGFLQHFQADFVLTFLENISLSFKEKEKWCYITQKRASYIMSEQFV